MLISVIDKDEVDGLLTEYNGQFQRLKTLLPLAKTKTQTMLIKNYTKVIYRNRYRQHRQITMGDIVFPI